MTALLRCLKSIPPQYQGGVLTLGNFDGVHCGHQALVRQVVQQATEQHIPSVVMTFEPHPIDYFKKNKVRLPRLTRLREKLCLLAEQNVSALLVLHFNHHIATLEAREFIQILYQALRPKHIIIGDDFRFGRNREGDFTLLREQAKVFGFSVQALASVNLQNRRISSTWVREVLAEGNFNLIHQLLNHRYFLKGKVIRGDQLGRKLGFPTANIYFKPADQVPIQGIYTTQVYGLSSKEAWPGVASIGLRPTLNIQQKQSLLEVHLLDFCEDIYGQELRVEFCSKLRDEERYDNLDLLKEQIAKDVQQARDFFDRLKKANE